MTVKVCQFRTVASELARYRERAGPKQTKRCSVFDAILFQQSIERPPAHTESACGFCLVAILLNVNLLDVLAGQLSEFNWSGEIVSDFAGEFPLDFLGEVLEFQ